MVAADVPRADRRKFGHAWVEDAPAREILTRATGFMDAYDYTLNPYSGCAFGCSYCYAAFFSRDAESRDNWGRWVKAKTNGAEILERRLRRKPDFLDGKLIYMSSVTDPYQPVEREIGLTRGLLSVMAGDVPPEDGQIPLLGGADADCGGERRIPKPKLVIQTRSPDVVRDCDLFRRIERNGGRVQVNMTVTTDDEDVRRAFEPYCPSNSVRLRAIGEVKAAGVDACVTMTPLLLARDPDAFAADLLATGVEKFIIQPFHFQRGKFVASTRDLAFDIMAEKLGTERDSFRDEYMRRYQDALAILRDRLPSLGEGKDGFAPPF